MSQVPFQLLLVEDDPNDVQLTETIFEDALDTLTFSTAENGAEALAFLRREGRYAEATRPDLILLDLNMPRMNGLEFLTVMKRDPQLRSIPVLVLTTSELPDDIHGSYERYANGYIQKPKRLSDYAQLAQVIQNYWFKHSRLPLTQ